jgi:hypothetical protein
MKYFLALLALAAPAHADEIWTTAQGEAFYDIDVNQTAVFSVPVEGGVARLYIPGLAGVWPRSGVWEGYWLLPETSADQPSCDAMLAAPDGSESHSWGSALVAFDDMPATGWTALTGWCTSPAAASIRANPLPPAP